VKHDECLLGSIAGIRIFQGDLMAGAAGYLDNSDGSLNNRGSNGNYWSSTQNNSTNGYNLNINDNDSNVNNNNKAYGFSGRCL